MKDPRRSDIIAVCTFAVTAAALSGGMFFLDRPAVSETEKRELEKFPVLTAESWFSGKFAEGLDKWFTDTVPYREELVGIAAEAENARGIASVKFYGTVSDVGTTPAPPETTDELPEPVNPFVVTEAPVSPPPTETSAEISLPAESETSAPPQTAPATETSLPPQTEAVSAETSSAAVPASSDDDDDAEFTGNIGEFLNNGILVDGVDMYGHKAGVMLFGGSSAQGREYASVIASWRDSLGKDVNVYNMVVPTSAEFYLPAKFSRYSSSEKDAIDNIYSALPENVTAVDAYSRLAEHSGEYIYFRTDHHWTDLGAYYAYTAFCDSAGIDAPDLSYYERRTKDDFVGSLYSFTGDVTLKGDPDSFEYFVSPKKYTAEYFDPKTFASKGKSTLFHEYASGVNTYGLFLGADNVHIKITADEQSYGGRSIAVFKESYGNAFVPYLIDGFDTVYVIDIRYFGKNALRYLTDEKVTDVLFINNVFAANTDSMIDRIRKLFSSPLGSDG